MGGFSLFRSASPPHLMPISNANLCVFVCCFCFSVVVVWVFYCVIFGVRRWWVGCGWGVDGCWLWGWAVGCGGGGWFFYFVFLYIVGFFNVILILEYIILIYRIEE